MVPEQLEPSLEQLREEDVFVQAWKKTASYIRYHNWFSDTLALDRAAVRDTLGARSILAFGHVLVPRSALKRRKPFGNRGALKRSGGVNARTVLGRETGNFSAPGAGVERRLAAPLQNIERGEIIGQDETGVPVRGFGGIQKG